MAEIIQHQDPEPHSSGIELLLPSREDKHGALGPTTRKAVRRAAQRLSADTFCRLLARQRNLI